MGKKVHLCVIGNCKKIVRFSGEKVYKSDRKSKSIWKSVLIQLRYRDRFIIKS